MKTLTKKQRGKLYRKFANRMERGMRYVQAIGNYATTMGFTDLNNRIFIESDLFTMGDERREDFSKRDLHNIRIIGFYLSAEICNA